MKLFSIFGNPVAHSISPKLHNTVIDALGLDACYTRTHIENPSLLKDTFIAMQLDGANVTVPHKEVAFSICDEVRGIAQKIKAVNTLVKENNKIIGYNTDAPGFLASIESFGKIENALILGAGGTAKAVAFALDENKIHTTVFNRSKERLGFFTENKFETYHKDTFSPSSYDLIINTTSAGLNNEELPCEKELLEKLMQKAKFAFDVIYNKPTPFLTLARQNNLTCKDGSDMLLHQGILAFHLFFHKKYDIQTIKHHMKKAFSL
ncbi:MAG: shikimate dehydrogenase [Sulfurospirillaceae bacterium]|nr:shikimate dehydrogenase [Sulfurospirillaceae bacterium]MDD3462399.1 shikimate dehydrogenase [Sulfurospirillaceae bacterium]